MELFGALKSFFDGHRDAIFVINEKFEIVYYNTMFFDYYLADPARRRREPKKLKAKCFELAGLEICAKNCIMKQAHALQSPIRFDEIKGCFKNGSHVNLAVQSFPLNLKDEEGNALFIESHRDMSDEMSVHIKYKQMLQQEILAKEKLEHLVLERTQELRDSIQQLKIAQNQLVQSSKMASIGTLVGGIAHEFNNILTTILGNIEFVVESEPISIEEQMDSLKTIHNASLRAREIVDGLLSFSRHSEMKTDRQSLRIVVLQAAEFIRKECQAKQVDLEIKGPDVLAMFDAKQIQQVVLNLLLNALQAVKPSGKISVSLSEYDEQFALIVVEDNGIGIQYHDLGRVFDPFFSTKGTYGSEGDRGTGLGLSISYGIVQNHQGEIKVTSERGIGSRFEVYLPR